jgi:hypothetical protein
MRLARPDSGSAVRSVSIASSRSVDTAWITDASSGSGTPPSFDDEARSVEAGDRQLHGNFAR